MGIKRGNFENVGLGALAQSANPNYHQQASVASGLGALAEGIKAYAAGWGAVKDGLEDLSKAAWKFAGMSVDADKMKKEHQRQADEWAMKAIDAEQNGASSEVVESMWDENRKAQFRADNMTIFGVLKTPRPTHTLDDGEKASRRQNLGGETKKKSHTFGSIDWLNFEEDD